MAEWFSKCAVGLLVFSGLISLVTTVHYRSKVTIEEHLNSIGLPILAKDSKAWNKVFDKYKKNNQLKIAGLEKEDVTHLRNWCLNKAKIYSNIKNEDLLLRVSAWCTEPYTIKEWTEKVKERKINQDNFKKVDCFVIAEKHFLHEEDPIYINFVKDCTIK